MTSNNDDPISAAALRELLAEHRAIEHERWLQVAHRTEFAVGFFSLSALVLVIWALAGNISPSAAKDLIDIAAPVLGAAIATVYLAQRSTPTAAQPESTERVLSAKGPTANVQRGKGTKRTNHTTS
jgi:hypothetical protein